MKTKTKPNYKHLKTKTDRVDHHALLEDQYGGSRCPSDGVRLCWLTVVCETKWSERKRNGTKRNENL